MPLDETALRPSSTSRKQSPGFLGIADPLDSDRQGGVPVRDAIRSTLRITCSILRSRIW